MIDDAELLRRYAEEKSEAAFAELVSRHLDLVYSAALRRLGGDAHGAADVVQQVFGALARQAASLARHTVLPAWLYAATRNVAIDHIRAERRRQVREQEAHLMHELNSGPGSSAEWETLRPLLDEAMDALGGRDREAVVLRFFARQPFGEIGRALNLSEDAARMRVERALEKLRGLLGRRGITSTVAALGLALSHHAVVAAPVGFGATVAAGALTSASAAAVTPAAGFVSFMSTSKLATGGVALVLALGIGGAGYEWQRARAAETTRFAVEKQNAALTARVREQRERAEVTEQSLVAQKQALDAAELEQARVKLATAKARLATTQARQQAMLAEGEAFMARHPEVRQAALENWRNDRAGYYAPLLKALRLSPAQVERFKDLAAQGIVGIITGPKGEPLRFSTSGSVDRREAEAELRTLLGEEGYKQYKDWDNGGGAGLQRAIELGGALYRTETPLSAEQAAAIQRILAENKVTVAGSSTRRLDWDAIMARARDVLSEPQLAALGYIQAQDISLQASVRPANPPSLAPAPAR